MLIYLIHVLNDGIWWLIPAGGYVLGLFCWLFSHWEACRWFFPATIVRSCISPVSLLEGKIIETYPSDAFWKLPLVYPTFRWLLYVLFKEPDLWISVGYEWLFIVQETRFMNFCWNFWWFCIRHSSEDSTLKIVHVCSTGTSYNTIQLRASGS